MEPKVIVITGPTCSGKTKLSLLLAEKLKTEIISADSRQIYKHLNIGTAKPSEEELRRVKHHCINILDPDEAYSASIFENDALSIIEKLAEKKLIPVIAGGSGLYIKALVDGLFNTVDTDDEYREKLLKIKKEFGNEKLYEELQKVDPESAAVMLPQNWKRIMRALEVFNITGRTIGELQKEYKRNVNIKFCQYGLRWKRDTLYANIEARVDEMIDSGLVEETRAVLEKGYDRNLNSLNTVGYKEIISYLDNQISLDRAIELIKRNTRRFAKRQLTWFRADDRIAWFDVESQKDLEKTADTIFRREVLNER